MWHLWFPVHTYRRIWTSGGSWWLVAGCLLSSCLGWAAVPTPPPGWACPTRPRPSSGSVKGELQVDGQDLVQAAGEVSSWGRRTWLYSSRWSCLPSLCLHLQCPWWRSAVSQAVHVPDRWWCWWWSQPWLLTLIHHPPWSRPSSKCRSVMWALPGLVMLRVVQLVSGSAQLSPRRCVSELLELLHPAEPPEARGKPLLQVHCIMSIWLPYWHAWM